MKTKLLLLFLLSTFIVFSQGKDSTYITGLYKIVKIKKYKQFNLITIADTNNNTWETPVITKRQKFKCLKIKKNKFYKLALIYYKTNDIEGYIDDYHLHSFSTPMIAGSQQFIRKPNVFITPNLQGLCYQENEIIDAKIKNNLSKIKNQIYWFFYSIYKMNDTLLDSLIDAKKIKKSILFYNKIYSAESLPKLLFQQILHDMVKPQKENIKVVLFNIQDNIYTVKAIIKNKSSSYETVLSILVNDENVKIIGIDLNYFLSGTQIKNKKLQK